MSNLMNHQIGHDRFVKQDVILRDVVDNDRTELCSHRYRQYWHSVGFKSTNHFDVVEDGESIIDLELTLVAECTSTVDAFMAGIRSNGITIKVEESQLTHLL